MGDEDGGYDAPFIEPLDKDLECPICLMALRDPMQTPCGHLMCRTCIDRIASSRSQFQCPLDKTIVKKEEANPSPWHRRKVMGLQVKCSQYEKGCSWKGSVAEFERHQLSCNHLTRDCIYNSIGCQVAPMNQTDMDAHEVSAAAAHNRLLLARLGKVERELRLQMGERSNGVFMWKIDNWSKLSHDARTGKISFLFSDPFYAGYPGYKMCLKVFPQGADEVKGQYLSVGLCIMKGDFDHLLEWPFRRSFMLSVLDQQEEKKHAMATLDPARKLPISEKNFGKPTRERNEGRGFPRMISLTELESRAYIRDNAIIVRAQVHLD